VDLGAGVQGLLHVSEMGWSRATIAADVVKPGDAITVKVLRVDGDKIALGLKQLQADPWSKVTSEYAVGQVRPGRVTRVADFGAFVELEPGIEGLAHASTFPPTGTPQGWKETVQPGASGAFEILSVDVARRRIGVARVPEGSVRERGAEGSDVLAPGARLRGKVERHERFGVFVFLAPGRTGLMPMEETGLERGADPRKAFPVGSEVDVMVLEADPSSRRIRLSRRAVLEAEEKADVRAYSDGQDRQSSGSFGSLADKLKSALRKEPGR
jgi:small subunit ribosomal protein S1